MGNTGIEFVDNVLQENKYELLGMGSNGFALKVIMGTVPVVLKFTNSSTEFKLTRKLMSLQRSKKKYLDYSAEVYSMYPLKHFKFKVNSKVSSYKYIIITEYLICSDKLKNYFESHVFGSLMNYCFANKLLISEFIKLSKTTQDKIIRKISKDTINKNDLTQLIEILKLHHKIGSGDFHSGNIGYSTNGIIKAFDFDELQM